jgi:orotate phosphoribosyltransferase
MPKDGDRAAIIEDVVTAGTAVRETIALFEKVGKIQITALYVSVDRMERGTGTLSALEELEKSFGIRVYPIVTVREIIGYLGREEADSGGSTKDCWLEWKNTLHNTVFEHGRGKPA